MSTFVEIVGAAQNTLVRFCVRYWRLLLLVGAASWVVPTLIHAAMEETAIDEAAIQEVVIEEAVVEEAVVEEAGIEEVVISDRFTSHKAPALNASVCAPNGVALGGYDLVSYHQADAPLAGLATIYAQHLDLTYRFASTQNRDAFLADPNKYLPNYRGWCSTNLSMGRLACPDYTNYKLEDGKLLFFERVGFTNGLDIWNSDPLLHRRQADQNFVLLSTPR